MNTKTNNQNQELPAFKVTLDDASSYVNSMAKGITLVEAKGFFFHRMFIVENDANGIETRRIVTHVEIA